jgi:aryl-alcohol dehydrogenase-like predicted oxidoreductase
MAQLALAWCLRDARVSSVLAGATQAAHVDENVHAADVTLDQSTLAAIDRVLGPVVYR